MNEIGSPPKGQTPFRKSPLSEDLFEIAIVKLNPTAYNSRQVHRFVGEDQNVLQILCQDLDWDLGRRRRTDKNECTDLRSTPTKHPFSHARSRPLMSRPTGTQELPTLDLRPRCCEFSSLAIVCLTAMSMLGIAAAAYFTGRQHASSSAAEAWSETLPLINATAAVSSEKYSMATGDISDDAEGLFVLDNNSGLLQCSVIYPRSGQFLARFSGERSRRDWHGGKRGPVPDAHRTRPVSASQQSSGRFDGGLRDGQRHGQLCLLRHSLRSHGGRQESSSAGTASVDRYRLGQSGDRSRQFAIGRRMKIFVTRGVGEAMSKRF